MSERRTLQVFGTFVVWGAENAPQVISLPEPDYRRYQNWPGRKRSVAIQAAFGKGMDTAIPAWSLAAMELMALHYEGPQQERVRYLCAAIALNRPFNPDDQGPSGGTKVEQPKGPAPKGPRPRAVKPELVSVP